MLKGKFTLEDFQKQLRQIRDTGPLQNSMRMDAGIGNIMDDNPDMKDPEKDLRRIDGIINSMTRDERQNPDEIDSRRCNRIARGSGQAPSDVSGLLKQFKEMSGIMQQLADMGRY